MVPSILICPFQIKKCPLKHRNLKMKNHHQGSKLFRPPLIYKIPKESQINPEEAVSISNMLNQLLRVTTSLISWIRSIMSPFSSLFLVKNPTRKGLGLRAPPNRRLRKFLYQTAKAAGKKAPKFSRALRTILKNNKSFRKQVLMSKLVQAQQRLITSV